MCPSDTSPEAWRIMLEGIRRMTPEERIGQMSELSRMVLSLAESGMRQRYPHADEREIFLRMARLTLGPELFRRAYGDHFPERS
jgi:hypothetical protein